MKPVLHAGAFALTLAVGACSNGNSAPTAADDGGVAAEPEDAGGVAPDATADAAPTGRCADTFGAGLTEGFGRIDGVVYAVQKPSDTQCVMPNSDHLVLQVRMQGAVYRMVTNVQSDRPGDQQVRYGVVPHALPPPAFADGWHTGVALDYPATLGAHTGAAAFTPLSLDALVAKLAAELRVGDPVSVYAVSGAGRPESAHLIHRNTAGKQQDGAIVVDPTGASPRFLLFHFADQAF